MWGVILGAVVEAAKKIFGFGIERASKIASRVILMAGFLGFVASIVDFFLSKLRNYSFSGVDPCVAHFMNVIGFFPAISIFLQIISVGLVAKYAIRYLQGSL